MHRFVLNLVRYGVWTNCPHPTWGPIPGSPGLAKCDHCGAIR